MAQSRVVICGVGLIGGSFALALKKSALALRRDLQVVGMGRTRAPLEQALRLGVIDAIATDWASALDGADLVLLGMPVGQMPAVMDALAPHLRPHTIVTDGGSTKSDVVAAARAALGAKIGQFVPGHPIAGAEKSGVTAAQARSLSRQARRADTVARKLGRRRQGGAHGLGTLRREGLPTRAGGA
jgi:prephenate dehydrogenase